MGLTKEESSYRMSSSYCKMSNSGFDEEDVNLESHVLNKGPFPVLDIKIFSHEIDTNSEERKHLCGSWYYYYNVKNVVLRDDEEQLIHNFDLSQGIYEVPVSGLYTIMMG